MLVRDDRLDSMILGCSDDEQMGGHPIGRQGRVIQNSVNRR